MAGHSQFKNIMFTRRRFLKLMGGAGAVGVSTTAYGFGIEPERLKVTRYSIAPPQWPADFKLKIAVIADLHACNPWMSLKRIEGIVARTNALRPDMSEAFAAELPMRQMLETIYGIALDMYLSGKDGARGCFTVMTAASEAVFDPAIREMVTKGLVEMDRFFARIFRRAQERGELPPTADPQVLAHLASATLHTVAVRARAQVPRAELDAIVKGALDVMCGKPR